MRYKAPERFLVIRFRQMGDAVLATSLLNAIKRNFPGSTTDFVLNERIEPLFRGHPAIDRIITFSDHERHSPLLYIGKIWKIMRRGRYDVIIDMRSTVNTLPFSILSPFTRFRIGIHKPYTKFILNHRFSECPRDADMVTHDVSLLRPFAKYGDVEFCREISLPITDAERGSYRKYMVECGVDMSRPVLLCGVVSKLAHKSWPREYMVGTLRRIIEEFPSLQLVFNYAPGHEAEVAHEIYEKLGRPAGVFMNVQAASMRELVALASLCSGYWGNEGGARHIAHAVGCPSIVVVSPGISKCNWLPATGVYAEGIACDDVVDSEKLCGMSYGQRYESITPEFVRPRLIQFIRDFVLK